MLLAIPSSRGLIVLSEPIISLVYQRGEFTAFDTNMTAWALIAYSVGLAAYAAIKVVSPAFYALDDAKTPMYISLASILVHLPASFGMMQLLSNVGASPERPNGFGHAGVALATSIVATVNLAALAWFMRRKIKRINGREVFAAAVKILTASIAMSAAAYSQLPPPTRLLCGQNLFDQARRGFRSDRVGRDNISCRGEIVEDRSARTIDRYREAKIRKMIKPFNSIHPTIHESVFIADDVFVIGDVEIAEDANIWYGSVVRGDVSYIRIGARTKIQDMTNPGPIEARAGQGRSARR